MQGSRMIDAGGIAISCTSPEARGLIDDIMTAWEKHRAGLDPDYEPTPYAFTYWLVRWSGLVRAAVDSDPALARDSATELAIDEKSDLV